MPYITDTAKAQLEDGKQVVGPGELNYTITKLCLQYIKDNGGRYQEINDVVGALEACKLEFYRRLAAPYEDQKIKLNGDVY